ncbi:MAG: hypothetical protein U0Y10_20670 [Spirosomataceae bacterium]
MRRTPNKPSHVLQVEERGRDGTARGQAPAQGTRTGKPPPQKMYAELQLKHEVVSEAVEFLKEEAQQQRWN